MLTPSARALFLIILNVAFVACSASGQRGIADKRSNFESFLPMKQDSSRDGLRRVKPYFKRANREQILRAVERACAGQKSGSSIYDARTGSGYYVNCNPRNRQLLNGYASSNPSHEPHSRP
jgi:hypothetical protein